MSTQLLLVVSMRASIAGPLVLSEERQSLFDAISADRVHPYCERKPVLQGINIRTAFELVLKSSDARGVEGIPTFSLVMQFVLKPSR